MSITIEDEACTMTTATTLSRMPEVEDITQPITTVVESIGITRTVEPARKALTAPPAPVPMHSIDYDLLKAFDFTPPPECPVFCPTPEEFALGPIEYIHKIRDIAEPCGICKIVPPKDFKFPFVVDTAAFKFSPRVQRLNEIESTTRIKLNFYDGVFKFWQHQGVALRLPQAERKTIDLYNFHTAVLREGGYEICTRDRKWAKIAAQMKLTKHSASYLRSYYEKLLFPYDIYKSGVTSMMGAGDEAPIDHVDHSPAAAAAGNSRGRQNNAPMFSPKKEEDEKTVATIEIKEELPTNGTMEPLTVATSSNSINKEESKTILSPNSQNSELKKLNIYGAGPRMSGVEDRSFCKPGKYCCLCGLSQQSFTLLTCTTCSNSFHRACLMPPMTETPKSPWNCHPCLSKILPKLPQMYTSGFGFFQSTKTYSLNEFGVMADEFKRAYFKCIPNSVPRHVLEKEFWRITSSFDPIVSVEYGADLHTVDYGSGFPNKRMPADKQRPEWREYIDTPWNLNNLPTSSGSVFEHVNTNIDGMSVPWMYVGMCFSAFCWHNEDHWTYSINYLHWGEPKTWYGVPGGKAEKFEEAMKAVAPELFSSQPDLLHHLVTTCNPNKLMAQGVPIYRTNQEAGQFVVTFPRSYHAGFNQGLNFAEAVNFATYDWLPMGRLSMAHYAHLHRYPVFSHDELVCRMADQAAALDLRLASATFQDFLRLIEAEKALRFEMLKMGINATQRTLLENLKDDERQCDYCHTTCFLSALKCHCSRKLVCLYHADHVCDKCSPEDMTLIYRYSVDELKLMNEQLSRHLSTYHQWAAKVADKLSKVKQQQDRDDTSTIGEVEKVQIEDLLQLLDFAKANKFSVQSPEYVQLKSIVDEAQLYGNTARQMIKVFGDAVPVSNIIDENKENKSGHEQQQQQVSNGHCSNGFGPEKVFSLEEIQCLTRKVDHFSFAIPEAVELDKIYKRVFQVAEKITRVLKKSPPTAKAKEVGELLVEARLLSTVVDFGSNFRQLELRHSEIAWLEKHDALFKQNNHAVNLSDVAELLAAGLKIPTTSKTINQKVDVVQKIVAGAKRWIEKVDGAVNARNKPPASSETEAGDTSNDNQHLPSLDYLDALLQWCNGHTLMRTADYSIDLSPQYEQLLQAIQVCKTWNEKADELTTAIQKVNGATAPDRLPLLSTIESFVEEAKKIHCRLERQNFFVNVVTAAHHWSEHLVAMFELGGSKLYRALDVMIPRQLNATILTTYTSRNTFLHLTRKVTYDRKEHPFLQAVKAEGIRSAAVQRMYLEYGIVERETILMLRAKHKIRRRLVESITLDEVEDRAEVVATAPPPKTAKKKIEAIVDVGEDENSSSSKDTTSTCKETINIVEVLGNNKLCFCGKDFEDYLLECYLCRDWFHRACINYVGKNSAPAASATATTTATTNGVSGNKKSKSTKATSQKQQSESVESDEPSSATTTATGKKTDEPAEKDNINRQELYLCCLCLRGRRPRVKEIDAHHSNLKKLSAQFVEAEVYRCYRERVHVWLAKLKQEMRQHQKINVIYQRVARAKGDTRNITPDEFLAASESDYDFLDDLIFEGALLEAEVDELVYLWRVYTFLKPDVRTVFLCPSLNSKRKRKTATPSTATSTTSSKNGTKKLKASNETSAAAADKVKEEEPEEGVGGDDDDNEDSEDEEDPCFMAEKCLVRKGWDEKDLKWVQCDKCDEWFHLACQGIHSPLEIENISFFCTSCKEKLAPTTTSTTTNDTTTDPAPIPST